MTRKFLASLAVASCSFVVSCTNTDHPQTETSGSAFENYKVADGFELQMAASEPLIKAPVVMDFDNRGRMWVVEMQGYMPNLAGTGEDAPSGKITILEDQDGDGVAEHSKTFMDNLVLPRAIAHVYGGLLYAVPPSLWFVEINDDKPGKKTLVDSVYSDGGNVESQPNGLMMNADNWIYNANSNFRYQLRDGKWLKEPTPFRGQWGISRDDYGRLYYNSNEIQLSGDYVLPNSLIANPYFKPKAAIDRMLTEDQHVYPLHPTTVNRGGEKGILNKDSLLVNVTAACGPLVYRGGQFPAEYHQNVFLCEPEGNLVKRDILTFGALATTARQAYAGKEFLASTDERFRPVNVLGGPDGAMYVIDMHRGIMQHRAYATPYYRKSIARKELDTVMNGGRIIRVKYKDAPLMPVKNLDSLSATALVELLKSPNGWTRDRVQQLLVFHHDRSVVPALQAMLADSANPVSAIHALRTLDGLGAASFDMLQQVAMSRNAMLSAHALQLLENYSTAEHAKTMEALAGNLMSRNDTTTNLYLAITLAPWIATSRDIFLPILAKLSKQYKGSDVFQEAVVSSLKGVEEVFYSTIKAGDNKYDDKQLDTVLHQSMANRRNKKMNSIFTEKSVESDKRTNGLVIFRSTCAACHGADGEGRENIAPPLTNSPYVQGPPEKLAMILLNGLTGPVQVDGKTYQFNGSMPNFGNNFNDQQIADVIGYLHNSFVTSPPKLLHAAEMIKSLRGKHNGPMTEAELKSMATH